MGGRRIFARLPFPQSPECSPRHRSVLNPHLLSDSSGLLQAEDADGIQRENTSQQREDRLHKGRRAQSGTNCGPGGALL